MAGRDAFRTSRFHDENDVFMGWGAFRDLPLAAWHWSGIRAVGRRPELPWWPYAALRHIEPLLRPDWHVVEFGSGLSTLWLARRVGRLLSIEDDRVWYDAIRNRLDRTGLANVRYEFRDPDDYHHLPAERSEAFDFAVVDGSLRYKCVESVLPRMRPGGLVYLDNSDADKDYRNYPDEGRCKKAQALLEAAARQRGTASVRLRSLAVGMMSVSEGMLVSV